MPPRTTPAVPAPRDTDDNPTAAVPSSLPDLASRALGSTVVAANDEFFAAKENLITPADPTYQPQTFDHRGQVYDGWETRRRRVPGDDWVIVRLGMPGAVHAVVVDTAFFTGNYPERCSVQATALDGYPDTDTLLGAEWVELVPESPLSGDTRHTYPVADRRRFTHLRLRIFPDGGVARLRAFGEVLPDPRDLAGLSCDLLAVGVGGRVLGCSDAFFARPGNLLLPDPARTMGEGWETRRRRGAGNDWVELALGVPGVPRLVELDTRHFMGNAPGAFRLGGAAGDGDWSPLLPETRLQPGTVHRFRIPGGRPVDRIRLDILPDGGVARLRLHGRPTDAGLTELARRWYNALPEPHARAVLATEAGLTDGAAATTLTGARPVDTLPEPLRGTLLGT